MPQAASRSLAALLRCGRAMADFDRQRLWVQPGHASVFYYLHQDLKLSKGAAHWRRVAAQLIQKFPEMFQPFRDGRLCLTTIVVLAKVLTVKNSLEVLPRYFHLSRREAAEVSAANRPVEQPPLRDVATAPTATSKSPRFDADVALPMSPVAQWLKTIPPGVRPGSRRPRLRRKPFCSPRTFAVFT